MKHNTQLVAVCAGLVLMVAGCANKSSRLSSVPVVPEKIKVPQSDVFAFASHAKGFQIYVCRVTNDNAHEWVLKSPEADLYNQRGKKIGRHYAGPAWESSDGSKVMGELKGKAESPDINAISWLLLSAKKREGNGMFSKVTSIQRLNTVGGKAPLPSGPWDAGKEIRVPYEADYYFYISKLQRGQN